MRLLNNNQVNEMLSNKRATSECCLGGVGREPGYPHIVCLSDKNVLLEEDEPIATEILYQLNQESQEAMSVKKDYFDVEVA